MVRMKLDTVTREYLVRKTLFLMRKYGIRPRKRLSQNFIVDPSAIRIMVSRIKKDDVVLEIGSGLGILTSFLAEKAKRVIAIEIDKKLVKASEEVLKQYGNVEIICGDFLRLKIPPIDKVVSNIPYHISSKILVKLLKECSFRLAVLSLQKEFAYRMIAQPSTRNYGRLTVLVQYYSEPKIIRILPTSSFIPPPKVESAIVELKVKRKYNLTQDQEEKLFEITRMLFSYRNKLLSKVLKHYLSVKVNYHEIEGILSKRVYELSMDDLIKIAKVAEFREPVGSRSTPSLKK